MKITIEYLAGFFDGEGSVGLYSHFRYGRNKEIKTELILPQIVITQRDRKILNQIEVFLESNNIGCHLRSAKNGTIYRLVITGLKEILKFCEMVVNYSFCKREELDIMINYCLSRIERGNNSHYTEQDYLCIGELMALKNVSRNVS